MDTFKNAKMQNHLFIAFKQKKYTELEILGSTFQMEIFNLYQEKIGRLCYTTPIFNIIR